jgi:DNA polymerase
MAEDLEKIRERVGACTGCGLAETRANLVFGEGDPAAAIVFVGEAPGFNEDKQGRPFVGAAGKLLTELLAGIGLAREDVYIANVLKCRPPGNRDPLPEEIAKCKPVLFEQLKAIEPRVIVTLGAHATRTILEKDIAISKIHGRPVDFDGYTVFPVYHPAAALYAGATKLLLEEDFRNLREFLRQGEAPDAGETTGDDSYPDSDAPIQLGLF